MLVLFFAVKIIYKLYIPAGKILKTAGMQPDN